MSEEDCCEIRHIKRGNSAGDHRIFLKLKTKRSCPNYAAPEDRCYFSEVIIGNKSLFHCQDTKENSLYNDMTSQHSEERNAIE